MIDADLEGIVAKRLPDAYHPKLARWHKVLNRAYSQRRGRANGFASAEDAMLGVDETTDDPAIADARNFYNGRATTA